MVFEMAPAVMEPSVSHWRLGIKVPLDQNEGPAGRVLLRLALNTSLRQLWQYGWLEEVKPYQECLVPARVFNKIADVRNCGS